MGKMFSIDSLIYKIGTIIIDIFYMNLLWFVFTFIGLGITGGASTTALLYVMQRRNDNKGNCNFKEFFYAFRKNFYKATIIWIILIMMFVMSIVNINYIPLLQGIINNSYILIIILAFQVLVIIELIIIYIYIFILLTKNDIKIKDLFKIAFVLAHRHMFTTITCIALLLVISIGLLHVPIIFFAGISGYALLSTKLINHKFFKVNENI